MKTYCINLDRRPERLADFQKQAMPGEFVRVPAVDGQTIPTPPTWKVDSGGGWGSLQSHIKALEIALDDRDEHFLICEDDARWHPTFPLFLDAFIRDLPLDWEYANFGGYPVQFPEPLMGVTCRIAQHNWIECVAYSRAGARKVLEALRRGAVDANRWADTIHAEINHNMKAYSPVLPVVGQDRRWSDNHGGPVAPRYTSSFLQGWFSDEEGRGYLNEVLRLPPGRIVEVGSYRGRSASWAGMGAAAVGHSLLCVDLWKDAKDARSGFEWGIWRSGFFARSGRQIITPVQCDSREAAKCFEDGSLMGVFIDAEHSYDEVKRDIQAWLPKVKSGGTIMGHDFRMEGHPGVEKAVLEFVGTPDRIYGTVWARTV